MLKKLFSHTLIYAIGPRIPLFGNILILPLITKDLTEYDFGMRGLIYAVTELLLGLKYLGIEDILVQIYYKQNSEFRTIWSNIYAILQIYLFPYAIVCITLIYLFVPFESTTTKIFTLLLISISIISSVTSMIGVRLMQLQQKPITISKISIVTGFLNLFLVYLTISIYKLHFLGWFLSTALTGILTFILYLKLLNENGIKMKLNMKWKTTSIHFKNAFPLIPNKYGHYLLKSSDKMLMGILGFPIGQIGIYSAGYSIGNIAGQLKNAISSGISPILFSLIAKDKTDNIPAKLVQVVQFVFLGLTFTGALWAKEITNILMSNAELKKIYPIVIIVIMSQNYAPLRFYYTNFMLNENRQKIFWKVTLLAGIVNLVINLLFLIKFGIIVAAISTFVSYLFMTYYGYKIKFYKEVKTQSVNISMWMTCIVLSSIVVYIARDIPIINKMAITTTLLVLVGIVYKVAKKKWLPQEMLSNA